MMFYDDLSIYVIVLCQYLYTNIRTIKMKVSLISLTTGLMKNHLLLYIFLFLLLDALKL